MLKIKLCIFCSLHAGRGTILDVNTHLVPVQQAIWEARSDWKKIGRILGVTEGDICTIRFPKDGECLNKVLCIWMKMDKATIHHLLNALEDITVGHRDICKHDSCSYRSRQD